MGTNLSQVGSPDFALITVIPEELEAVREAFELDQRITKGDRDYYTGWVNSPNGSKFVIACRCEDRSNLPSYGLTSSLITHWAPRNILVVGIAGGVRKQGASLGDVATSDAIAYSEIEKESPGIFQDRSIPLESPSSWLRKLVTRIQEDPKEYSGPKIPRPDRNPQRKSRIIPGLILAGEKLQSNPHSSHLARLLVKYDKAIAIEMESGGVARAVYDSKAPIKIHLLVIRGISDLVDAPGNQSARDKWKVYAAKAAATLALAVVKHDAPSKREDQKILDGYLASFNSALSLRFPTNRLHKFTPTYRDGEDKTLKFEQLLDLTLSSRRLLLEAGSGHGKTISLVKLAQGVSVRGIIPIFLNMKDWKREYTEELGAGQFIPLPANLEVFLRVSIADLNSRMMDAFPHDKERVFFIDGLNEVYGDASTEKALLFFDQYVRQHAPLVSVIATTRHASKTSASTRWLTAKINPLPPSEVRTQIVSQFSVNTFNKLSESSKELLRTPYFLDFALGQSSPELGSASKAFSQFFIRQLGLTSDQVNLLATAAFSSYKEFKSPTFSRVAFLKTIPKDLLSTLETAGAIKPINPREKKGLQQLQWDHQLKHDFLAAKFLAISTPTTWTESAFEIASLGSNSFEAVSMALEQFVAADDGDEFLRKVYDWNWLASLLSVLGARKARLGNFSPEMETALRAVVAEKLLDPIKHTRERSRRLLEKDDSPRSRDLLRSASLPAILKYPSKFKSKRAWFRSWQRLFSLKPPGLLPEEEISLIASEDPITGWTAANVIRRFPINEREAQQLRTIYLSFRKAAGGRVAVRWRAIHALGAYPSPKSSDLLLRIVADEQESILVRYGAARSLVEIAAKCDSKKFLKEIVAAIKSQIKELPPRVLWEIGQSVFFRNARSDWHREIRPLLSAITPMQQTEAAKTAWGQIQSEFDLEFSRRRR